MLSLQRKSKINQLISEFILNRCKCNATVQTGRRMIKCNATVQTGRGMIFQFFTMTSGNVLQIKESLL